MKHIDLFSGIGGFALAAREVWGDKYENVCFCEINKFCQEVLKKNFGKDVVIYDDIRLVSRERFITDGKSQRFGKEEQCLERSQEWSPRVDSITGGFPCQPFSQAGKRKGTSDDRHLWPEMLRVIRDFKPTWIIAENVRGLLSIEQGVVFEQVCVDLEASGYETQAFIIPACAVNAPHRRDRVWIVAHKHTGGLQEPGAEQQAGRAGQFNEDSSDTKSTKLSSASDTRTGRYGFANETWNQNWIEVATRFCRVDDGLPARLDGLELSKAKHRVERLKALGNAIVPQVAVEIMRAIKSIDERR